MSPWLVLIQTFLPSRGPGGKGSALSWSSLLSSSSTPVLSYFLSQCGKWEFGKEKMFPMQNNSEQKKELFNLKLEVTWRELIWSENRVFVQNSQPETWKVTGSLREVCHQIKSKGLNFSTYLFFHSFLQLNNLPTNVYWHVCHGFQIGDKISRRYSFFEQDLKYVGP